MARSQGAAVGEAAEGAEVSVGRRGLGYGGRRRGLRPGRRAGTRTCTANAGTVWYPARVRTRGPGESGCWLRRVDRVALPASKGPMAPACNGSGGPGRSGRECGIREERMSPGCPRERSWEESCRDEEPSGPGGSRSKDVQTRRSATKLGLAVGMRERLCHSGRARAGRWRSWRWPSER